MKYIISFIVLISLAFCEPPLGNAIPAEEHFVQIKKNILDCIVKSDKASAELKEYATEYLNTGHKDQLKLYQFRNNESDRFVIRQCRREAFSNNFKRKPPEGLKIVSKDKIKPRMDN